MLELRSSTVFHLLCGAIALEALGLLGMVAAMLYPLLAPGEEEQVPGLEPPPAVRKVSTLPVSMSANRWMITAWPPPSPDEAQPEETTAGPPVDAHDRITFIGRLVGSEPGEGWWIFQRQSDGRQWLVRMGQESAAEMKALLDAKAIAEPGNPAGDGSDKYLPELHP